MLSLNNFILATIVMVMMFMSCSSSSSRFASAQGLHPVIVPSKLRAPLDVWESTFQLRKTFDEHHPSIKQHEDVAYRRVVFLDPLSFQRNTTERGHNHPLDEFNPFWSGRATEDPNIVLEFHEEIVEDLDKNADKFPLEGIYLYMNPSSWATPCFRSVVREVETDSVIVQSDIVCPPQSTVGFHVNYTLPEDESVIMKAWSKDSSILWKVTVEFERIESTSFSFISPGGFDKELLHSHEKYDVTPENASLGFKFMIQVGEKEDKFEVWAFRKPPMPDFRLSLYANSKHLFSESINNIGQTANAFGVQHKLPKAKKNDEDNADKKFEDFIGKEVAMFATFAEARRQFISRAFVEDFSKVLTPEILSETKENKEGENYREHVIESLSAELRELYPDLTSNVQFIFRYFPHTGFAGFYIRFPFPVKNVLVSLWLLEDAKTQKRVHLFLREADADIPHGGTESHSHLYGWDDALPIDVNTETQSNKFHEIMENPFEIEVQFDKIHHDDHESLAQVLTSWIGNAGGDAEKLDLSFLDVPHHSHAKTHPLLLNTPVKKWDELAHNKDIKKNAVALVPMYSIFSASIAMNSGWGKLIAGNSKTLEDYIDQEKLHPDAQQFMYLTLATLSHVYDGSHNFRPLFRIFEQSAVNLPPLYHTEELNLFSFSDAFTAERQKMINMWNEEYEILVKLENKLRREVSREMYYFHRSQVEARAVNGSNGEMQLIPLIDLAPHSDTPSAEVRFDDEEGSVLIAALQDIEKGGEVTINYGTSHTEATERNEKVKKVSKTQLGFLLQHGFVPSGASKSTGLLVKNKKGDQERIFALFEGRDDSIEDLLTFYFHGERFNDELSVEELAHAPSSHAELEGPRLRALELIESKLASLPTEIPDVSDSALSAREKEKHEAASAHKHHHHHHSKHNAHKERPLDKLRASFDAARESAIRLLKCEKETLEYFVEHLKKVGEQKDEESTN